MDRVPDAISFSVTNDGLQYYRKMDAPSYCMKQFYASVLTLMRRIKETCTLNHLLGPSKTQ